MEYVFEYIRLDLKDRWEREEGYKLALGSYLWEGMYLYIHTYFTRIYGTYLPTYKVVE